MDIAQVFLSVAGWIFFAAWGLVLAAVCVVAFGRDIFPAAAGNTPHSDVGRGQAQRLRRDPSF
jgi:hypothetical protein